LEAMHRGLSDIGAELNVGGTSDALRKTRDF
jgi:hypothetical protein